MGVNGTTAMARICSALPRGSKNLPRYSCCCIVLYIIFETITLASAVSVIEKKSLKDVVVHEGDTARFLCYTSYLVTSSSTSVKDNVNVTIVWTFEGQPLHFDLALDLKDQRVRSTPYDDRRVLEIRRVRKGDAGKYACSVTSSDGLADTLKGTLTVQSVPSPPVDVVVTSCHGNSASLSWRPGNSNGADIITFSIQFNISDKPDTWFDFYEDVPGKRTQTIVELSPYGTYSFRVLATNAVGTSQPSNVTSRMCTTPIDRPDRNPQLVWTTTDMKGYLVVKWEPLHRLSFHGRKFHYIVLWRLKGSLAWNSANVTGSYTTTWQKKVDQVYAIYELQVKAANEMGEAHQPPFKYLGRSFEAEPMISVSHLRVDPDKNLTSNTAHLMWESIDPTDPKIRGKFRGYKILYSRWYAGKDKEYKVSVVIPGHGITAGQVVKATVSDLPAHSTIRFQVVVANTHYHGPPSDVIDVFTPEGVPSMVRGLFSDSVTPYSVVLKWLPPEEPNGVLTGFDVGLQQVLGNRLGKPKILQGNDPHQLRRRIEGLKANTRYRIHLVAKTKTGGGKYSFIDVQTARRKKGRKNSRQSDAGRPTGRTPSASRKESSYDTDRMQSDIDSGACQSGVSNRHFIFIMASCLFLFLTVSARGNWS